VSVFDELFDSVAAGSQDAPVFVISVAAELSGLHAQTLRQYDRIGLVSPGRTAGGGRRYSLRDIGLLREVQRLSSEGHNLDSIKRILELERENAALRERLAAYEHERRSTALVVWRPQRRPTH
jgi:MerR family transcriptional regulator/heat shock protein HspR